MLNIAAQIKEIKEKLPVTIHILNKNFSSMIAESSRECYKDHNYQFGIGKTWTQEEIIALEKKYALTLPEEYKQFLLEIGDGGVSFTYDTLVCLRAQEADFFEKAAKPFSLVQPYANISGEDELQMFIEEGYVEEEAIREYIYELPENAHYDDGTMAIGLTTGHHPVLMVMNGRKSGEIWIDATQDPLGGCIPTGRNFLSLYIEWLDKVIESGANIEELSLTDIFIGSHEFETPWIIEQ